MLENEISIVKKMRHSSLLKFVENYSTSNNFYLIFEHFSNINLTRFIEEQRKANSSNLTVSFKKLEKIFS